MDIHHYARQLKEKLHSGLPGKEAQLKMVSDTYKQRYFEIQPDAHTRESAVLILLYPEQDGTFHFPLIVRPSTEKGVHSGQVAFPGGKKDDTDLSFEDTALREAQEEINVNPKEVQIIGQLSPLYVFASNFMVYPVLGYVSQKPTELKANPDEVAEFFSVPTQRLQESDVIQSTFMKTPMRNFETPYFNLNDKIVWGATAMILSEFVDLLP